MMTKVFTKIKYFSTLMLLMFFSFSLWSQSEDALDIALRHLKENKTNWNLTDEDISDLVNTDQYVSNLSGATMLYLTQHYKGLKVQGAIYNVAISEEGKVVHAGNRIISDIANKVSTVTPNITPEQAIQSALEHLKIKFEESMVQKERKNKHEFFFGKGKYSKSDIPVRLHLYKYGKNVILTWETEIEMISENNYWRLQIDANTGKVLLKNNMLIKCSFGNVPYHNHDASCRSLDNVRMVGAKKETKITTTSENANVLLGGSYNVYAEKDANGNIHPIESPNHGGRSLLSDVENLTASPYGWHDTDGQAGAEYNITRGNNAHAYLDIAGNGIPQGNEPNGGASLFFNSPLNLNNEPEGYTKSATINAFFMVNYLHDFVYVNGFDEVAGAFQVNNYGNGGQENDYIKVEVHDGSQLNNADFLPSADGFPGKMQMYLWNAGTEGLLTVNTPLNVAGIYNVGHPNWGADITTTPITGEVVIADDGSDNPTFACTALINATEMNGKVALIDRGLCDFGDKVFHAETAGAVGAIICNFDDELIIFDPGVIGDVATIPVVMMTSSDCAAIRGFVGNGLNLSFVEPNNSGPAFVSGALDNGVIAHEFGHGVSHRLIGGPNTIQCLNNQEQMGEGISDFLTLVTMAKPGDIGEMEKTIGTYIFRESIDGRGIRTYPFSTDMNLNPLTYKDIVAEAEHARGTVWATVLWDMYWLFVEEYGFDPDLIAGNGGNNRAVRLVMEGMKLGPCSPGYVDGRDAILSADSLLYNGVNQCRIWEAFARRGLGELANQVDPDDTSDGFEDFSVPGNCSKDVRLTKTVSETVVAGQMIDVKLEAINYKDDAITNVVITDEIPTGTTVVAGSGGMVSGNTISFNIASMASLENVELNYQLETDPDNFSVATYTNDMENDVSDWDIQIINGMIAWDVVSNSKANSGVKSWFMPNLAGAHEQAFFQLNPILVQGTQPVVRFYHWYATQTSVDGGIVELSINGGATWEQLGDKMFRNGYQRVLSYRSLFLPFLSAFSGISNLDGTDDFRATYIDLSDYLGQTVQLRFRFGANTLDSQVWGNPLDQREGWYVDDIEYMDMRNYEGQACLTSLEGDDVCADGIARGTIVESVYIPVSTNDLLEPKMEVKVYPNPADEMINLQVLNDKFTNATVSLLSVDGKEVLNQSFQTSNGLEILNLNISNVPAGMYFLKVSTADSIVVEKVMIR